jgi:ribose transport system permease protein
MGVIATRPVRGRDLRSQAQSVGRVMTETPALQLGVLVALFAVAALSVEGFLSKSSLYSVLILAAFLGIAATGQTIIVLLGAIDLTVPAIIGATNLLTPMLIARGWGVFTVILVVLCAGTLIGGLNGYIVRRLEVSPLIVTLASGAIIAGAALGWTNNGLATGSVPGWLTRFSSPIGSTFGIAVPPVVVLWGVIAVVVGLVLKRTVTGHHIYATGANERAAELAGVRTVRVWVGAFALSGLSAAGVGVLLTGFIGSSSVGIGDPYLFTSLGAVLVGGTSLVGARGDYWRTVLGALIATLVTTLLVGRGAGVPVQQIVFGLVIMAFVALYGREQRVRDRV